MRKLLCAFVLREVFFSTPKGPASGSVQHKGRIFSANRQAGLSQSLALGAEEIKTGKYGCILSLIQV